MPKYRLVTTPATEPLNLNEVKLFLRVDDTTEEEFINTLITAESG